MSTPKSLQQPHVNFQTGDQTEERKKRYLTAKYGQHQMNLIKKRLKVEMWMYEQLQVLYEADDCFDEIEIDLDELLDYDNAERVRFLRSKLIDAKQSKEAVEKFIVELLERANTL